MKPDETSRTFGGIPNVRMLIFVPAGTFRDMLARVPVPVRATGSAAPPAPREASAIELVHLAGMWRVAWQADGLLDWDIPSPTPQLQLEQLQVWEPRRSSWHCTPIRRMTMISKSSQELTWMAVIPGLMLTPRQGR